MKSMVKFVQKWVLIPFLCVLRALNLLEPPDTDGVPGRDYFPILSWSKIARILGLVIILMIASSGQPLDITAVVGLLTWAGGEAGYRYRQYRDDCNNGDNTDVVPK